MLIQQNNVRFGKCCSCEESIRQHEQCLVALNGNGKPIRGERYCLDCREIAEINNPIEIGDIVDIPGDNRTFVMTADGPRAGHEHTGRYCEDAPCCGCCGTGVWGEAG